MLARAFLALLAVFWPWLLVLVFFYATAEGYLNFGGGEKDIILAAPLALVALFYSLSWLVLWWRGRPTIRAVWQWHF